VNSEQTVEHLEKPVTKQEYMVIEKELIVRYRDHTAKGLE
jgi:hypothetical protein